MPKSKNTKSKSAAKSSTTKKKPAETVTPSADQTSTSENAGGHDADKSRPAKSYKVTKPTGLTHSQKAALARHIMVRVGDLMEMDDAQLASEELNGIDRKFMGSQLAAWVSYLPGSYWDARLPQPSRARGRRKL